MNKRKLIPSLITNAIIFTLMIIGIIIGFTMDKFDGTIFAYFTTNCNLLMGIASAIYCVYIILLLKKKINTIPKWIDIFKYSTTVCVVLTFLTTCLFLAPTIGDATILFSNSLALFHVAIPLLSLTTFLLFDKNNKIKLVESLYGLVFIGIYCIFYLAMALSHIENGKVVPEYDWYGFTSYGLQYVPVVVILMLGVSYLISWLLWLGYSKINIKYESMYRWQYKRFWSMFVNGLIFLLLVIAMLVRFIHDKADWSNFKYFTTQSNIFIGIVCLIYLIFEGINFNNKEINMHMNTIKLIFTTYITITFVVTVFALTPGAAILKIDGWPPERLYLNANLLLHVFIPVLSIANWLLLEHCENIKFDRIWYSFIYVTIYGAFYLMVAYTHIGPDGKIPMDYDWYKFCSFNFGVTVAVFVAIYGITFLFTWMFRKFNMKINLYKDLGKKKQIKRTSTRG